MPLKKQRKERILTYYNGPKIFWFRFFGFGLSIRSIDHGYVPFSIRYGYRKGFKFFNLLFIEFLHPEN